MSSVKLTTTGGSGGTIELNAPANTTGDAAIQLTLPVDDGTANQYLKTDGSGALSWATVSSTPEGTAILSTTNSNEANTKFLRADGDGTCSWQTVSAGAALTGSTDNTICTVTGANAIQGEANLTWNGDILQAVSAGSSADGSRLDLKHGNNNTTDVISSVTFSNTVGEAARVQGETSGANNSGLITFHTDNAGTSAERLRITTDKVMFSVDAKVDADNARDLGTSGTRWKDLYLAGDVHVASGKGIDFSATGGPSSPASDTSELLDDYEEGTFSPEVLNGWGVVDPTYSTNSGYYTKIGNVVYILFRIVLSGGSLNGNQLLIYKFPYGAKSTGGFNSALNGYANVANGNATAIHLQMDDDYTIHRVWYRGSSGNNAWSGNDGGSGFDIVFSGSYLV